MAKTKTQATDRKAAKKTAPKASARAVASVSEHSMTAGGCPDAGYSHTGVVDYGFWTRRFMGHEPEDPGSFRRGRIWA